MSIYVFPYSSASESAKLLAERLGALRIKLQNSTYNYKEGDLVVNWGNSNCHLPCLNPGELLKRTINKLSLFRLLKAKGFESQLPEYWTDYRDIPLSAYPVLCRTKLEGCDGAGIVIANSPDEVVEAPLYTKMITNCNEYRVTLFKGYGVTDIQEKRPRVGVSAHPTIKTYANGWGFQRRNLTGYPSLWSFAEAILEATGLDFAGLDIIEKDGKFYMLEVNSAMGLEGQALDRFAEAVVWYYQTKVAKPAPVSPPAPAPAPTPAASPAEREYDDKDVLLAWNTGKYDEVIRIALTKIKL